MLYSIHIQPSPAFQYVISVHLKPYSPVTLLCYKEMPKYSHCIFNAEFFVKDLGLKILHCFFFLI